MRYEFKEVHIVLENEQEIVDFYNIVMFALDLQAERDKKKRIVYV